MTKRRTKTAFEREEADYVKQHIIYRTELIHEFMKACKISKLELCTYLSIGKDSVYRYLDYERKLPLGVFIRCCYFFKYYMKEHNIPYTDRIMELISRTSLFSYFNSPPATTYIS